MGDGMARKEISRFLYENKVFVLCIFPDNEIMFYRDGLTGSRFDYEPLQSTQPMHDIKRPVPLLRRIISEFVDYIFSNGISHFSFTANNDCRIRLYTRVLNKYDGYRHSYAGGYFYVYKN